MIVDSPTGSLFPKMMSNTACPVNYYCERGNAGKQACASDKFCPEGSAFELPCQLQSNNACIDCPAGQYRFGIQSCAACEAGYVCLGGTSTRYPLDATNDKGYECTVGNYCPSGSDSPTACPAGTYNPSKRGASLADCLPCPDHSYNPLTGQSTCLSCGASATHSENRQTCVCRGAHRTFLK